MRLNQGGWAFFQESLPCITVAGPNLAGCDSHTYVRFFYQIDSGAPGVQN